MKRTLRFLVLSNLRRESPQGAPHAQIHRQIKVLGPAFCIIRIVDI